ncbi:ankyrin repeat-containing domain protein [Thelonectria olida]|uniref:Ankyrin repeat-containing domain protein n=1 Tax=Thelonectria olida TaxID=1576542 RepID=A0A9P8VQK7_9HYPO|nr:ankyrin repeat-containing domain protein [Thelonectria olida]
MPTTSPIGNTSSNNPLVDDVPIVWYSGSNGVCGPTDDLVHGVLAGNVARVRHLSILGFTIPAVDSWVVYEACLQSVKMMHALSMNPRSKLNRVMPWQMGDRNIHFLLRTPSGRFLGSKMAAIAFLIQNGAHPLERDRLGNTALHILAEVPTQSDADGFGIMKVLLDKEDNGFISKGMREACISNIDSRNIPLEASEGSTALMNAVMHGHTECVRVLLEQGANPHLLGPLYQSPLHYAVRRDFLDVVKVLLQHGAVVTSEVEEEVRSLEIAQILADYRDRQMAWDSSETSEE